MAVPPLSVAEYSSGLPDHTRAAFESLRSAVRGAAPEAVETISYGIPTLKVGGRLLVSYAAFTRHVSLYPASDTVQGALGEAIRPYLAGKGTIRLRLDQPVPVELVRRVVEIRLAELAAARDR